MPYIVLTANDNAKLYYTELKKAGPRRSGKGTGFGTGNVSGNLNDSSPRELGKGSSFSYNETGGSPDSRRFSNPGGPSGPGGPGSPGGPSSPNGGGPLPPNPLMPTPIPYYYYKAFYKDFERFKGEETDTIKRYNAYSA
ncbi:hypothetical protein QBC45DRAFT_429961 [Copromyces sp. CBS 386.78]|nr:hypothetical protein QBC45DRAFT_429961 [Copromyces sp. CBS 386.78]